MEAMTLESLWQKFRNDVLHEQDDDNDEIQFMRKIFYTGASCFYAVEATIVEAGSMKDEVEGMKNLHRELAVFKVQMVMEAMAINSVRGDGDIS